MQAEFRAPRRRARVQEEYEAPLPVSRDPEERSDYRAHLINQHVLVCHPDHIQKIHNQLYAEWRVKVEQLREDVWSGRMSKPHQVLQNNTSPSPRPLKPGLSEHRSSQGYFGKGILSRARPDHSISDQWEQHAGLFLPVVSQSRYEELLRWAGSALSAQGLDEEAVCQTMVRLSQPVEMEEVRREGGGVGDGEEKEGPGPELEQEAKRSCRLDVNPERDPDPSSDQDSDSDSGTDPDPDPVAPGPGFVLVVSDSEVCVGLREVRRSPLTLTEYLQLSLEEAFFLVYSLGCLSVYLHQEPLSIIHLWRKFRSLRPDFVSSFAAYQHCRSRGWVPKEGGGAKYGVDFMLYRKGPPFYHASYSVVVERVDGAFRGSGLRRFSWRSLAALSRVTSNVSKELMMCYVIYPADLSEAELDSPVCLSRLKVQEVIVSRWVSSRERAEQDDI